MNFEEFKEKIKTVKALVDGSPEVNEVREFLRDNPKFIEENKDKFFAELKAMGSPIGDGAVTQLTINENIIKNLIVAHERLDKVERFQTVTSTALDDDFGAIERRLKALELFSQEGKDRLSALERKTTV